MTKLPIIVCIDVEPHLRAVDPTARIDWAGVEDAFATLGGLRLKLSRATGRPVHFTWFLRMDPQVEHVYGAADWAATRYRTLIEKARQAGDAIGLHIHPWRWDEGRDSWIADYKTPNWGEHCVHVGFDAFEKSFGVPCTEVRFGDRWLNERILAAAQERGALYDLTVEPGRKPVPPPEPHLGLMPDYSHTPRDPYRAAPNDFQTPVDGSDCELQMIPVSTATIDWAHTAWKNGAGERLKNRSSSLRRSSYDGWIDEADVDVMGGWIFDAKHPDKTIEIEIYDNGHCIAVVPAALYRPDLAQAGISNGRHAFRFPWGSRLRDGKRHELQVRAAGTDFEISNGPKVVGPENDNRSSDPFRTLDLADDPLLMCAMTDALLTTYSSRCLVYVARTHMFASPEACIHVERNLRHLATHPRAADFAFTTPAEAIHETGLVDTIGLSQGHSQVTDGGVG